MRSLIQKYARKLHRDRSIAQGRVGIAAQDDLMLSEGAPDLSRLAADVLSRLSCPVSYTHLTLPTIYSV